ncbi:MAG: hypothetical protein NTY38_12985 [Acidobacteria bacterium]|nr:hypothetical protein [Acidobacteriota bacterium]
MRRGKDMIQPLTAEVTCTVREATFEDFDAISGVACRNGLVSPKYGDWVRLWKDNPFRAQLALPVGWVLEAGSQHVVGTFSNIPRIYYYNGEAVRTAVPSAWAVDPQYRHSSVLLVTEFFSQKNVDLFLNTTASSRAAAIFKAFRCQEVPHPSYKQVLFWVIRRAGFADALLRRMRLPPFAGLRQAAILALWCRGTATSASTPCGRRFAVAQIACWRSVRAMRLLGNLVLLWKPERLPSSYFRKAAVFPGT